MGQYILVIPSSPVEGQAGAYNSWYGGQHLADLLKVPGVQVASRYEAQALTDDVPPAEFLAIYQIETEDPQGVLAEIVRRSETGEIGLSPALDMSSVKIWLYQAL
ncbi:hypothetical protein [Novosphingobium malaysiense]|uniref:Uncharacterized protein n=1 Tax=Novosphingobium malaysiense TaxID=1348853 RepID=A0A0B1ZIR4_9SPHN|nr:hypothetical protein [Novosphingobium malaysiense]KHK90422.1 hypothetical protein LK12_17770 [Novosphingobium malaysiense]